MNDRERRLRQLERQQQFTHLAQLATDLAEADGLSAVEEVELLAEAVRAAGLAEGLDVPAAARVLAADAGIPVAELLAEAERIADTYG